MSQRRELTIIGGGLVGLAAAIELAQDSTHLLDRAFGPSKAEDGGDPRIGVA